jgi:hypothetical protein
MPKPRTLPNRLSGDSSVLDEIIAPTRSPARRAPKRIAVDPEKVERGLAQLVLTLIEAIRQLLERQAIRRVEGGSLSDEEVERLGETFIKLDEKMEELKKTFDLRDEDLNLDLGPLGKLR